MTRVASGFVLALSAIALLFLGSPDLFFFVIAAVIGICLFELYTMLETGGRPSLKILGIVVGPALCGLIYFGSPAQIMVYVGIVPVILFASAILSGGERTAEKALNTIFGIFYVAVTLSTLVLIRKEPDGNLYIIMLINATAFGDIFAYYTGRLLGKRKLAPQISPNKTVEGFAGGLVGAVIGATIIMFVLLPDLKIQHAIATGLIAGLIGPVGDLAESAIKRSCGVKDSGRIIPGHGGLLDRADSLMFCGAAFYAYFRLALLP